MPDTLVIDQNGNPIKAIPWREAVTSIFNNRARVLHEAADRILRSPSFEMNMPITIQMRNWDRKRRKSRLPCNRRNVMIRDNSTCQYCGRLVTTHTYSMDHVIPRSRGGKTVWENIVLACHDCNWKKSNKTLKESGLRLVQQPTSPNANDPRYFKIHIRHLRPEWKPWESWLYWNITLDK